MTSNSFEIRITRDSQGRYQASCPSIPRFSSTASSVSDALCKLGKPIQEDIERRSDSEGSPNLTLPFFAYGIFKGGELGFLQIEDHVASIERASDTELGRLWIRDGLPICIPRGEGDVVVSGDILSFKSDKSKEAYDRILALEPKRIYEWKTGRVNGRTCNYLVGAGEDPAQGAYRLDMPWSGQEDHLFTTALELVREIACRHGAPLACSRKLKLKYHQGHQARLEPMRGTFELQMAYMLLWASIERYGTFRHGLFKRPEAIVRMIGKKDIAFKGILKDLVCREDTVFATNRNECFRLDASNPESSIMYYYQIRCNATHRGKGGGSPDRAKLLAAISELLPIFEYVKDEAFEESSQKAAALASSAPTNSA